MTKTKLLALVSTAQIAIAVMAIIGLAIPMVYGPSLLRFLLATYVAAAAGCALGVMHALRCYIKDKP